MIQGGKKMESKIIKNIGKITTCDEIEETLKLLKQIEENYTETKFISKIAYIYSLGIMQGKRQERIRKTKTPKRNGKNGV